VALTAFRSNRRWQLSDDMDLHPMPGQGGPNEMASTIGPGGPGGPVGQVGQVGEEALDRRRQIELLDRALARLDPDLLEVFVLFEIEGLTTPEVAALIEIPLGTVASRLRRARESFRDVVARMERAMRREVSR
jgi:RNA polymerase sigma factor (sigma-70 family)